MNKSFKNDNPLDQTMQAKQEAALIMEKIKNVKATRQNMNQLKNRIETLKRNVELEQKKEQLA